jgi:hypothetical protein
MNVTVAALSRMVRAPTMVREAQAVTKTRCPCSPQRARPTAKFGAFCSIPCGRGGAPSSGRSRRIGDFGVPRPSIANVEPTRLQALSSTSSAPL